MIEIYEDDDTTLVAELPIPSLAAGADSTVLTLHLRNTGESPVLNARLVIQVEDRATAGLYVSSGWPPVDETWARARVVGFNADGDPTWSIESTDWRALGAFRFLPLGDIPAGCDVYVELKMRPPSTAAELDWRWSLGVTDSEYSAPAPPSLTAVDQGIVHGVGDCGASGIIRGCAVTVTSPAEDDEVHVAAGVYLYAGRIYGRIASDHALNQQDVASAALTTGQSYYAALTLSGSGVTVTKGTKATSPTKPTLPAGNFLTYVKVRYQAGGTSEILSSDLEGTLLYDRYLCVAGSGLQVKIHPGRALGGSTVRFSSSEQLVSVVASDTSYLWQLASGLWEPTLDETQPESTATGPWWEVTTDGSGVTAIVDRRTYAGRTVVLRLAGAIPGSPGLVDDLLVEHEELWIEEVTGRTSDNGGGASGQTKLDLEVNGSSLYPSAGTDDQRPVIAYNASTLVHRNGVPDGSRRLRRGDLLELSTVAHPTGGTPDRAELLIVCRVP